MRSKKETGPSCPVNHDSYILVMWSRTNPEIANEDRQNQAEYMVAGGIYTQVWSSDGNYAKKHVCGQKADLFALKYR